MGFHDPHSGVRNFEVAVGTSPGDTDELDWWNVHKVSVMSRAGISLPCNNAFDSSTMYIFIYPAFYSKAHTIMEYVISVFKSFD